MQNGFFFPSKKKKKKSTDGISCRHLFLGLRTNVRALEGESSAHAQSSFFYFWPHAPCASFSTRTPSFFTPPFYGHKLIPLSVGHYAENLIKIFWGVFTILSPPPTGFKKSLRTQIHSFVRTRIQASSRSLLLLDAIFFWGDSIVVTETVAALCNGWYEERARALSSSPPPHSPLLSLSPRMNTTQISIQTWPS